MERVEFVNKVFDELEKNHIFLYHDISKEEFEKQKNDFLKRADGLDQTHFDAGILRLFALFKDAHVNYFGVDFEYVGAEIALVGNDFYIKDGEIFSKIEKVNGHDIKDVVEKLKQLIAYETDSWAYYLIAKEFLLAPKALQMIDCGASDKEISFQCVGGKCLTKELQAIKKQTKKPYECKKMCNDNVLYIRYSQCVDMKSYPFVNFVEDIKKEWKKLPKACLVDVRDNTGGSDVIIYPLLEWLKESKIKTFALMNEGTFSSGTFALASLKKEANATLLGTNAGQPTRVYGNNRWLSVDGKEFKSCERYFELTSCHDKNAPVKPYYTSNAFNYAGVIKPDVKIETKVEDLNKGVDSQLKQSLIFIENALSKSKDF